MKYITEFRDPVLAEGLIKAIRNDAEPDRHYALMEFCGGHTHIISRCGIEDILPANIRLVHGPGCPVCVLPTGRFDNAIELVLKKRVTLCTYADTLRVPASNGLSLMKAKAEGADVRIVYSASDALDIAHTEPDKEVVFFAIGFETTAPATAFIAEKAVSLGLKNFSIFSCHVLTPSAMRHILQFGDRVKIDGFIGPAHVSTVIGTAPYEEFACGYHKPVVVAGFEPLDLLQSVLMLVRQINRAEARVENEFTRAVGRDGNPIALDLCRKVFEVRATFEWRGLGCIPYSALKLRERYAAIDAEKRFNLVFKNIPDKKICECGAILRGEKSPEDCRAFASACTPDHPIGSCMVSNEGACAARFLHRRNTVKRNTYE